MPSKKPTQIRTFDTAPRPGSPVAASPAVAPALMLQALKAELAPARYWVKEALLSLQVRRKLLSQIKSADALAVHIATEGPDVTLTGVLELQSNLVLAESAAQSVDGVRKVTSKLTYAPGAGMLAVVESAVANGRHGIKDALLETRVKSKLLVYSGVGALKIVVIAENGVVKLSGSVPDKARRDDAVLIARKTGTVKKVRDLLQIKPLDFAA
jgi:osmotically-inducible protein OsmY